MKLKCRPQHGLSSSCFRWHVFGIGLVRRKHADQHHAVAAGCLVCVRDQRAYKQRLRWMAYARLNTKAVSAQLPLYKLTDLLYQEARITARRHDENVVRHEAAKILQSKSSAHVQHKLSVLWTEYRPGTWSVDGLLRACSACICQWDCGLRYNRQSMQTRIIYRKNCVVTAIYCSSVSDM